MKLPNRVINEREVTCAMDGRGERQRGKGGGVTYGNLILVVGTLLLYLLMRTVLLDDVHSVYSP